MEKNNTKQQIITRIAKQIRNIPIEPCNVIQGGVFPYET